MASASHIGNTQNVEGDNILCRRENGGAQPLAMVSSTQAAHRPTVCNPEPDPDSEPDHPLGP